MAPKRESLLDWNISHRVVSVMLIVAGGLLLHAGNSLYQYLYGGLVVVVGAGVWQFQRWARWMALGACFLVVIGAIVFTFTRFLIHSSGAFEGQFRSNLGASLFAFAMAVAAYRGLSYLRSERGRFEFAGRGSPQEKLLDERSSAVALSALVWVVLGLMIWYPRQFSPVRLYHLATEGGQRKPNAKPNKPAWMVVLRERSSISLTPTPDLIPLGLCYRDHIGERVIHLVYISAGGFPDSKWFRYGISKDFDSAPVLFEASLPVPKRDKPTFAELGSESDLPRGKFLVHLDVENVIQERDENNNVAEYEIPVESPGLPECERVKMLYGWRDGPTITTATVRPPGLLPDLVPLGLCSRGRFYFGMQFTNRGKDTARGHFVIAQGRSIEQLTVKENLLHGLPETDSARGFNIGTPHDVFGRVAGTYDYFVKLDPFDAFQESNEMNNVVSARFTIHPDGTIDLPDCDALAERAADHDWVADDVMLQPALVPMPDLVPLGLCIKDWGARSRYLHIVYGNIGDVRSHDPVRVELADPPQTRNTYIEREQVPGAGRVGIASTARRVENALAVETVTVDSAHAVGELSETNNSATYELSHKPDGSLDLPDCESVGGRISDWIGKMNPGTGHE